jgi:hypothetical protein
MLDDPAALAQRGSDLYYLARKATPPANIYPNDGTIQQLKSSGNLRLVHNKDVANSIMSYDQKMRKALFEMGDEVFMRITLREQLVKIFDNRVFIEMTTGETITKPAGNPALFSRDASLINEFTGDLLYIKRIHQSQAITSVQLLRQADSLLHLVNKVYRLK